MVPDSIADLFSRSFTPVQERIADAAISVIARQGFDVVSVRTVATASHVAAGTVQYHFPSREDLLIAALVRSVQRQTARMDDRPRATDLHDAIVETCLEFLPVDETRLEESIVWVAFSAAGPSRDWIGDLHHATINHFRLIATNAFVHAAEEGALHPALAPALAGRLLAALVNGLTIDFINAPANERSNLERELRAGVNLILPL